MKPLHLPFNIAIIAVALLVVCSSSKASTDQPFGYETVFTDLTIPWEIEFGPDSLLWVTERPGLFSRINLETGTKSTILDLRNSVHAENETGMLGFCFHPNFADTPWVFVAYVTGTSEHIVRVVERFTFTGDSLVDPVRVFTFDPAGPYHQGCRLFIDDNRMLWVTMGDTPGGDLALSDTTTVGKLLRMNLDGSAPDDNPLPGNLLWTKGHRNIQGFVQLPNGIIWTSEHGNIIEDEVNLIVKGGNYGWPYIEGIADLPDEISYRDSTGARDPKWSTGPETTFAPCGLRYYNSDKHARLKNSLLLAFLKDSKLMQFELNGAGDSIVATHTFLNRSIGRIRDIAIGNDGSIYLCTSNREPNGYLPFPLADDDRIVRLIEYTEDCPPNLDIPDTVRVAAVPGYPREFTIPITNNAACPTKIDYSWNLTAVEELRSTQWRIPIVLIPGQTYLTNAIFEPTADSLYTQTIGLGYEVNNQENIYLFGNTDVGVLASKTESITIHVPPVCDTTLDLHFFNPGTQTVSITGASIEYPQGSVWDDIFTMQPPSLDAVAAHDSVSVPVRITTTASGTYGCTVSLSNDSYLTPSVQVIVVASPVESVTEPRTFVELSATPNPLVGSTRVSVPDALVGGSVNVFDALGNLVASLSAQSNSLVWDGTSADGQQVAQGAYYITIHNNVNVGTCMVVIQKQ